MFWISEYEEGRNMNDSKFYAVLLEYSVWPEIYVNAPPYMFPTRKAAVLFAKRQICTQIVESRVYDPFGHLVTQFQFA